MSDGAERQERPEDVLRHAPGLIGPDEFMRWEEDEAEAELSRALAAFDRAAAERDSLRDALREARAFVLDALSVLDDRERRVTAEGAADATTGGSAATEDSRLRRILEAITDGEMAFGSVEDVRAFVLAELADPPTRKDPR